MTWLRVGDWVRGWLVSEIETVAPGVETRLRLVGSGSSTWVSPGWAERVFAEDNPDSLRVLDAAAMELFRTGQLPCWAPAGMVEKRRKREPIRLAGVEVPAACPECWGTGHVRGWGAPCGKCRS